MKFSEVNVQPKEICILCYMLVLLYDELIFPTKKSDILLKQIYCF
jgi:hypothetical protein